ncbi:MAG: hypothetical protein JWQ35_742 [Bacteriovoracaceae bacterium]|nr:hypothetical protein [Bacteriovoracaceae bacterium]
MKSLILGSIAFCLTNFIVVKNSFAVSDNPVIVTSINGEKFEVAPQEIFSAHQKLLKQRFTDVKIVSNSDGTYSLISPTIKRGESTYQIRVYDRSSAWAHSNPSGLSDKSENACKFFGFKKYVASERITAPIGSSVVLIGPDLLAGEAQEIWEELTDSALFTEIYKTLTCRN